MFKYPGHITLCTVSHVAHESTTYAARIACIEFCSYKLERSTKWPISLWFVTQVYA